ncbi:MAG TPA: hypothetical protein VHC22_19925 [Pirellulales bacterium]|nr:hypothetical protein [Pirellulales bacterium]
MQQQKRDDSYHGQCRYVRTVPEAIVPDGKSVNVRVAFDEGLKLATAIQSAILSLNRLDQRTKGPASTGLKLVLDTKKKTIRVYCLPLRERRTKMKDGEGDL